MSAEINYWVGEKAMGWPIGKVSDIAEVISGFAFKSTWFGSGKDKVIRIGDLKDGYVDLSSAVVVDAETNAVRDIFKIREGDILMALSGATVGKIAVAGNEVEGCYLNQRVAIVRAKSKESKDYLKYVFSGQGLEKLLLNAGGAAQPNLSPKNLAGMEIPLPPLAEQQRIAAILDKADVIRRKRQQAIQLADEFLRAVFLDMFGDPVTNPKGWEVVEVGSISEVQGGLQVSSKRASNPVTVPYLRVANVLRDRLDLSEIKEMNVTGSELGRVRLNTGDILIVEGHGNPDEIGRSAIWDKDVKDIVHQNHLIRVRPDIKKVSGVFLNDFINSSGGRTQMANASNTTSGLNTISTGIVKSTKTILPSMKLQTEYATIVLKARKMKANLVRLLAEDDNYLFNSLSQKAFKGEL